MSVTLITGIQAAGKSTVAQALAERLSRSVHLRGESFRRCIVNGRVDMSPDAGEEAWAQLRLRYRLAAATADLYAEAGFAVIMQDVVLGEVLPWLVDRTRTRPRYVVVLAPRPEVVAAREAGRAKKAYGPYQIHPPRQSDQALPQHHVQLLHVPVSERPQGRLAC